MKPCRSGKERILVVGGERSLIEVRGSARSLPRLSRSELLGRVSDSRQDENDRRTGSLDFLYFHETAI